MSVLIPPQREAMPLCLADQHKVNLTQGVFQPSVALCFLFVTTIPRGGRLMLSIP